MNEQIRDSATFIHGKTKYLLCTDQQGLSLLQPILDNIILNNQSMEFLFIGENAKNNPSIMDIKQWLSRQTMGTYLYIACEREKLKSLIEVIEDIGFTNDEVQFIGYGTKKHNVFCCRCYGINEINNLELEIQIICKKCNLLLSVSDHYSKLRDAYLGYVAKL
jgi:hypothetical protein